MSDGHWSLIDVGKLSEPVTKLITAVSDAVGVWFEPHRIKRRAEAEADATITLAKTRLEITDLERRAARRLGNLERRRQANIDAITDKAMAALPSAVSPNPVDQDWVYRFFGECQDVSDEEMQQLWAHILAREVATPGTFGLRTLSVVRNLTRQDADAFSKLATLAWVFEREIVIVAPTVTTMGRAFGGVFESVGLTFDEVLQLEALGLIKMFIGATSRQRPKQRTCEVSYFDEQYMIELPHGLETIDTGPVVATIAAQELVRACKRSRNDAYRDNTLEYFSSQSLRVTRL